MDFFSFERLNAYKQSLLLVKIVYGLSQKFPPEERFALTSQLRRAIVSVPSNIAEGSGRLSNKEKVNFISIAFGSLMESYCQLTIAYQLDYITKEDFCEIKPIFTEICKMLSGLRNKFVSCDVKK